MDFSEYKKHLESVRKKVMLPTFGFEVTIQKANVRKLWQETNTLFLETEDNIKIGEQQNTNGENTQNKISIDKRKELMNFNNKLIQLFVVSPLMTIEDIDQLVDEDYNFLISEINSFCLGAGNPSPSFRQE